MRCRHENFSSHRRQSVGTSFRASVCARAGRTLGRLPRRRWAALCRHGPVHTRPARRYRQQLPRLTLCWSYPRQVLFRGKQASHRVNAKQDTDELDPSLYRYLCLSWGKLACVYSRVMVTWRTWDMTENLPVKVKWGRHTAYGLRTVHTYMASWALFIMNGGEMICLGWRLGWFSGFITFCRV